MADTGIFATTAEVQYKAGANCSSTANTETYINSFMTQAESIINWITHFNWSDVYTSLNVDVKGLLKSAASAWAAVRVINYDLSGFPTSSEAQIRMNNLLNEFNFVIDLLKDQENRKFADDA